MTTGERIKAAREKAGISQTELAKRLGIPYQSIWQWESGKRNPKLETIQKIADALDINFLDLADIQPGVNDISLTAYNDVLDYIKQEESSGKVARWQDGGLDFVYKPEKPVGKGLKIPVLGYVRAGIPVEAVEEILDYEEIPEDMAARGEFFGLKIKGDSMEPRICEGDVVIVRQQPDVESGDIAVVLVNGDEATVKRVMKQDGGLLLQPFNPSYSPLFYSWKEVQEKPISIVGKVVELRGKFEEL